MSQKLSHKQIENDIFFQEIAEILGINVAEITQQIKKEGLKTPSTRLRQIALQQEVHRPTYI